MKPNHVRPVRITKLRPRTRPRPVTVGKVDDMERALFTIGLIVFTAIILTTAAILGVLYL